MEYVRYWRLGINHAKRYTTTWMFESSLEKAIMVVIVASTLVHATDD